MLGKPLLAAAVLGAGLLLGGCGGGGSKKVVESQGVAGQGFSVAAPKGWTVERAARTVTVRREGRSELVSVTVLPLRRRYRPSRFAEVAVELDRVSEALAAKLGGKVSARRSIVVGGIKARQYDLAYERSGSRLIDRITYVLQGASEYYLLCRWQADEGEPDACSLVTNSFRLT